MAWLALRVMQKNRGDEGHSYPISTAFGLPVMAFRRPMLHDLPFSLRGTGIGDGDRFLASA